MVSAFLPSKSFTFKTRNWNPIHSCLDILFGPKDSRMAKCPKHCLSWGREMAEEQLRTRSYQPDLSLFLICTHVTVTCALHMFRLHGWMLMLYQAVHDFTAGSALWAVGAALVHFCKADYSRAAGTAILQHDLSPSPTTSPPPCPDILCCSVYAAENICECIWPRWKILANNCFS